jgi:hypothetical protein
VTDREQAERCLGDATTATDVGDIDRLLARAGVFASLEVAAQIERLARWAEQPELAESPQDAPTYSRGGYTTYSTGAYIPGPTVQVKVDPEECYYRIDNHADGTRTALCIRADHNHPGPSGRVVK